MRQVFQLLLAVSRAHGIEVCPLSVIHGDCYSVNLRHGFFLMLAFVALVNICLIEKSVAHL